MTVFRIFFISLFLFPGLIQSQSYEELVNQNPQGVKTTLTSDAFIFTAASPDARPLGRFLKGTEVFAYDPQGDFYAVATEDKGFVGYVLITKLGVEQDPNREVISPIQLANYKDPKRARNLSLAFPGGGQFYSNNNTKGSILLLGAVGSFVGGYALTLRSSKVACVDPELTDECGRDSDRSGLIYGSVAALAFWAYGIVKAPGDAELSNLDNGFTTGVQLTPVVKDGHMNLGLALRLKW